MRLLVLGGTVFVGRHFVEAALARGHEVTLFHRGQRGADLFPGVARILGDRDGGLDAVGDQTFDAVVDCCGYVPRIVGQSAQRFKDKCSRYLFVSTISVFADSSIPDQSEDSQVFEMVPETEEVTGDTYGPLKVGCEREVLEGFGNRALIIRPGLIMGPNDPTHRFTYWAERFAEGGEVVVLDRPEQPMQLIDARDLGEFMVSALENDLTGTYIACGPDAPRTLNDMVRACQSLNPQSKPVWVSHEVLESEGVALWQELPLILPADGSRDGLMRMNAEKARRAGLRFRSWEETARDTWEWHRSQPESAKRFGLAPEKEKAVLSKMAG